MGKYSENAQQQEERVKQKEMEEEIKAKTLKVGDRCEVSVPKQPTKRGNVMYVGKYHQQYLCDFCFAGDQKYFSKLWGKEIPNI